MAVPVSSKRDERKGGAAEPSEAARHLDAEALAVDLKRVVRGEVRFDSGTRAMYATDGSNYRQPPIGVVVPMDVADVEAALAV